MDDGDYKFFLNLDEKFKFLANEKNNEKTDGFMVVEIVPPDQGTNGVILPKEGDHVHVWGAWVTDKPKGWHEIHPTWKVINQQYRYVLHRISSKELVIMASKKTGLIEKYRPTTQDPILRLNYADKPEPDEERQGRF